MSNPSRWPRPVTVPLIAVLLSSCGDLAEDSLEGTDPSSGQADVGPNQDTGVQPNDDASPDLAEPDVFVPEGEDDFRLQPPAASRTFVFVANTDLNSVARIDSLTLQIDTIEVGLEPTQVRTVPTGDRAVVLNEGSDDVSVIFADADDRVETVDVVEGANRLVLAPNGDFAMAYFDDAVAESGDEAGPLSDVSLIALAGSPVRVFNLVVGLHVREVEFDETGDTAFLMTEDGVAVVRMAAVTADRFVAPVRVSTDPTEDATAIDREVDITADGSHALVRSSAQPAVRLVDLTTGRIREAELEAVPTDLDLLPSGDAALAVLRDLNRVVRIPIPGAFEDERLVETFELGDETAGLATLIPGTPWVALFSTVGENDHLSLLDLDTGALETYALRKGIEAVFPSPDADRLLVLHTKLPGDPIPGTPDFIGRSFGYTVFNLDTRSARLVLTEARPGDFTFSGDGQMVFMLLADPERDVRAVEWANLATGRDTTVELRRLPQAIGVIPATGRVYVAEEHEVGRMAFIDPETGEVREVTGYHLNSRVE